MGKEREREEERAREREREPSLSNHLARWRKCCTYVLSLFLSRFILQLPVAWPTSRCTVFFFKYFMTFRWAWEMHFPHGILKLAFFLFVRFFFRPAATVISPGVPFLFGVLFCAGLGELSIAPRLNGRIWGWLLTKPDFTLRFRVDNLGPRVMRVRVVGRKFYTPSSAFNALTYDEQILTQKASRLLQACFLSKQGGLAWRNFKR